MRLFIAIQLPKEIRNYLSKLQKQFSNTGKITFTKEQHLTIKFLGEITRTQEKIIQKKLSTVIFQPFSLTLSGIGFFPDERNARILWVGLQLNNHINELQKKIDEILTPQFKKDKNFVPHITLGRIKTITNKAQFNKLAQQTQIQPLQISVNEFQLIESKLAEKEPKYAILQSFFAQSL